MNVPRQDRIILAGFLPFPQQGFAALNYTIDQHPRHDLRSQGLEEALLAPLVTWRRQAAFIAQSHLISAPGMEATLAHRRGRLKNLRAFACCCLWKQACLRALRQSP